jgi:hypothetical protein
MTTSTKATPRDRRTTRELTYSLLLGRALALAALLAGCGPIDDDGAAVPVAEVTVPETPDSAQPAAQACTTDADCADGTCSTWYRDADGDGYGSTAIRNCEPTPPPGYAARAGEQPRCGCVSIGNRFPTNCVPCDELSKR